MTAISIIVPVWNRAHCIRRAIDSVLTQEPSIASLEILVIDDGSSDDLRGALRCCGPQVSCIRHDRNRGAAAARNTGIEAARGEYVAFLDSDDEWLPGKLATQLAFMHANGYAASCTSYYLTRRNLPEIVSPIFASGPLAQSDLVWGCFISPGSTLMCARSLFSEIGGYDVTLQRLEDWDWLLRFAQSRTLGFLARPLARIEPSGYADVAKIVAALDSMRRRHSGALKPVDRRHFEAAIALERAAAYYRAAHYSSAFVAILKSLCLAPTGHVALRAIMHNRMAGA